MHNQPLTPMTRPECHGPSRIVFLLALLLVLPPLTAPAHAQSVDDSDVDMGEIERRIELIDPKSGPPGTVVRVNTADMPVTTPIRVGMGASQAGFEAFQELLTGQEGEFDVTVEVPDWATRDRVHVFIVFDIYFRPIALSDAFHVTDEDGLVRRTGRVERQDSECTLLRDIDGVEYALVDGDAPAGDLELDRTVTVEGRVQDAEVCDLRNVIELVDVQAS